MRELTMSQMSEMDGGEWGLSGFFEGFLCGTGIVASIALWSSLIPAGRFSIVTATVGACGLAFFG